MLDNVINVILLEEHIMVITLKIRLRIEFAIELKLFFTYIDKNNHIYDIYVFLIDIWQKR